MSRINERCGVSAEAGKGGLQESVTTYPRTIPASVRIVILACLLVACGGSGGNEDEDDKGCSSGNANCAPSIGPFFEARELADVSDCDCRIARGLFNDLDDCINEVWPSPGKTLLCLEREAFKHAGVHANLDCAKTAEEELTDCLRQSLDDSNCSEVDYDACFDLYHLDYEACSRIEGLVFLELSDCF